jgi:hypothetical protein
VKPLLLGMCNPLSDDPEFDLYPYPEGSAGWRLWKMLPEGTTRAQYLDVFDRRNLLHQRTWDQKAAREAAVEIIASLAFRPIIVVLGSQVRSALGLPNAEPLVLREDMASATRVDGAACQAIVRWLPVPHPSGRNRWYNEPGNRERVGATLLELARA